MESRRSLTRARICSGVSQLRLKRMKPSGSLQAKKSRSPSLSAVPAQPKTTARGGGPFGNCAGLDSAEPQRRWTMQACFFALICAHMSWAVARLGKGPVCTRW